MKPHAPSPASDGPSGTVKASIAPSMQHQYRRRSMRIQPFAERRINALIAETVSADHEPVDPPQLPSEHSCQIEVRCFVVVVPDLIERPDQHLRMGLPWETEISSLVA